MTGFETARTVRYTGPDADAIRRAFAADSERAIGAGFNVSRSRWDRSTGQLTLMVDYVHASVDGSAAPRPAAATSGRRGGLAEAMVIVGVVLAIIVVLAVALPPG